MMEYCQPFAQNNMFTSIHRMILQIRTPLIPMIQGDLLPTNPGYPVTRATWNQVNYVFNHAPSGTSWQNLQGAIWVLMGTAPPFDITVQPDVVDDLVTDAQDHASTWSPGVCDSGPGRYGRRVCGYPSSCKPSRNPPMVTDLLYTKPVPCHSTPSPEFPTLALPVGMLVGLIGAVLYISKSREE